jgi:hypothetical protein
MTVLHLLPVIVSLLVLGAHFLRAESPEFVVAVLVVLALLLVRRPWAARVVQVALVLGAIDWCVTLLNLMIERMQTGESYVRLVMILGVVTVATGLSALTFRTERLRRVYRFDRR